MKSQNQIICEYVAAHPLCTTNDVAAHIGNSVENTSKRLNCLEITDHVRVPTKTGRYNRWIIGTNTRFNASTNYYNGSGNGGGRYYPQNGDIDRKRVVTVATTAADAMALIASGYKKMRVL